MLVLDYLILRNLKTKEKHVFHEGLYRVHIHPLLQEGFLLGLKKNSHEVIINAYHTHSKGLGVLLEENQM